jgi:hypothetical protein
MSDIAPHSRDDLDFLPCDTEPVHVCGCSPYLCPVCNPRRSLIAALRDVSAKRDLPLRYFDADVVVLAEYRKLADALRVAR